MSAQNPIAELKNRYLQECARSLLTQAKINRRYWAEAVQTATYLQNRLPTKAFQGSTPYERWFGRKPRINHLKVFGSNVYAHVPAATRTKLDCRGRKLLFIGYSEEVKGYKTYDPHTGTVGFSQSAIFGEKDMLQADSKLQTIHEHEDSEEVQPEGHLEFDSSSDDADDASVTQAPAGNLEHPASQLDHTAEQASGDAAEDEPIIQELRRSGRRHTSSPLEWREVPLSMKGLESSGSANVNMTTAPIFSSGKLAYALVAAQDLGEPRTMHEALSGPDSQKWREAIQSEYNSIMDNQTWKLVPLPPDRKTISCRWLFRRKLNPDGGTARFKARLVVRGFT